MSTIKIGVQDRVFVLTGAGISAESGIQTFRDSDGLWAGHSVEDVCTPRAWDRNPALVWNFYSERRKAGFAAKPNRAHLALAELEEKLGDRYFLCTQNIDDLHEQAGSKRMVHMHGELAMARCERECGRPPVKDRAIYKNLDEVACCPCGGRLRPHIVFFGETPLEMPRIEVEISKSNVMIVVGTSGAVYPAAGFVNLARQFNARTIYIGPEEPLNRNAFSQFVQGKAGEAMPGLFAVEA
jgi:NAD-dependent deacetylase